jgi:DUF4097 and DUF4098 domain-containing protein YvlB
MKSMRWALIGMAVFATTATFAVAQMGGLRKMAEAFGAQAGRDAVASDQGGLASASSSAAQSAEDFRWSGRLAAGESLEIKGVNGSISAVPSSGSEVVVTAETTARRSDPSSVRIEMIEHASGLTFCAVYPTPEGRREPNYCAPGSGGQMSTNNNDVSVHFEIQVPADIDLIATTVNGDVEASGLGADVRAVTVNGSIDISTAGFAEAETVNGSIDAQIGSPDLRQGVSFSTVNGSITLDLDDDIDAQLDASWLNGSFESDLPFLLNGRMGRRSARGTLGDGGPELELSTVNGSIVIR